MCKCGVQEGHFHRPGCDLKVFPIDGGPDMTPEQAHALNRIYRRDYQRTLQQLTHLRDSPVEVETWETWVDHTTAAQVWEDNHSRPAYRRYQGVELEESVPGLLLDSDVRVYPCADGCGGFVCVSGAYAALLGPTDVGWFIKSHAPKGCSHVGPVFKQKACA